MPNLPKKWLGVAVLAGVIVVAVVARVVQGERRTQPIAFNHAKHVRNHVPCATCHPLFREHARAGMPGVKTCVRCHEDVIYRTPEKDKIQAYYQANNEIPWRRVYRVQPHTYFSHRRHTAIAKLDCADCHGAVARFSEPITEPVRPIRMSGCLDCHKRSKASVDCVDCHR